MSTRTKLAVAVAVVLTVVAGLCVLGIVGTVVWKRTHRTPLDDALHRVPASSLRVSFTDWGVVRRTLDADLGTNPTDSAIESFMSRAYDDDFSAASSIDESAVALQDKFGFSPANAEWEAYAQGRDGAAMVLKVADGTDFSILADNLRTDGYGKPKKSGGVWRGGEDLVAALDPTITPELQYVVLLEDQGLVVTSDTEEYAASSARAAAGDAKGLASTGKVDHLDDDLGRPANALVWAGDFACSDLAMSQADSDAQTQAEDLVKQAGGVTPLNGLAMAMDARRKLRVVEGFEDDDRARENLRPRAELAVGEAVGRGGDFKDTFKLTRSRTSGSTVVLDLTPRQKPGFVLSAVYDGPVIFATC